MLTDTHCHIHFPDYELDPEEVLVEARNESVERLICVGCSLEDSKAGIKFAARHEGVWASIGLHPHDGIEYVNDHTALQEFHALASKPKVVAIGETGLDYHYMHSSKTDQQKMLRFQIDIAVEHNLPLIFHIREAYADFWKIFDQYKGLRGVVHSFSATPADLEDILARNLYVGVNGIATFTKNESQIEAYKQIPLNRLLLETDAPFLTPIPYRGTICQPKHVRTIATHLATVRGESLELLAEQTTQNAIELFSLK